MRSEQKGCIPLKKVKQPSFSEKTLGSSISLSFILEVWANISDEDEILLNRKKERKKNAERWVCATKFTGHCTLGQSGRFTQDLFSENENKGEQTRNSHHQMQ